MRPSPDITGPMLAPNEQRGVKAPLNLPAIALPTLRGLNEPVRATDDARRDRIMRAMPTMVALRDHLKSVADSYSRRERRFGSAETVRTSRQVDDAWMALDALIADTAPQMNGEVS